MDRASDNGKLLASLDGAFPWGLLVVSDRDASDQIPGWAGVSEPVTSTASTLVVKVEHEEEGTATVHIYDGRGDLEVAPAFDGPIVTSSGELTVGDALGRQVVRIPVTVGQHRLRVSLNRPMGANHIDVAID
jgi:hypothetical protein